MTSRRPDTWARLPRESDTDVVFLTWQWQRVWWECFRREQLLLIVAEAGEPGGCPRDPRRPPRDGPAVGNGLPGLSLLPHAGQLVNGETA